MTLAASALALLVFAAFAWAVRQHFRPGALPPGMVAIALVGTATFLAMQVALWRTPPPGWAALAGIALMAASLALFLAAVAATRRQRLSLAFAPDTPGFLLRTGPYRLVRHPFYTAYLLFWAAAATLAPWPPVLAGSAAMAALYLAAARREEATFRASALAAEYHAYRQGTGAFLPRLSGLLRRAP